MAIQCHEFERAWNELLDAGVGVGEDRERALWDHAAGCPACRQVAERYHALRRAVRAWGPPPAPAAGLVDRILFEVRTPAPPAWPVLRSVGRGLPRNRALPAAAAAVAACLLGVIAVDRLRPKEPLNGPSAALVGAGRPATLGAGAHAAAPQPFNLALAGATEATWDLARTASEPAARISRQVIDVATGLEPGGVRTHADAVADAPAMSVSIPRLDVLAPDSDIAAAMLQQVGDSLASGVRPLSSTARHAFGFLLAPAPVKRASHTNSPAEKGA
jgi:hypothetical protein